jgi:membrane protease subunit (stomatin/prohibitin family)
MDFNGERSEEKIYPISPVPDDDILLPGELPFTAFGQHGVNRFDKRVFEQEVYWVDYLGNEHLIAEMEKSYIENVLKYLKEGVDIFYLGAVERYIANKLTDSLLERVNRDDIVEQFNIPSINMLEPIAWLESTPLYRKLQYLLLN